MVGLLGFTLNPWSKPTWFKLFTGTCNTSGVLNTKIWHVIICIANHSCVGENFDMHSLKQVYFYGYMC